MEKTASDMWRIAMNILRKETWRGDKRNLETRRSSNISEQNVLTSRNLMNILVVF
jgi:hypothetical protein